MTMRYHAFALTASVVTLAVGVVVGVGPLSEAQTTKHREQTASLRHRTADLTSKLAAARVEAAHDRALARELAAPLTDDRLADRTVLVIAAPGADATLVRRTAVDVRKAGATVTGTLTLTGVYVDPAKAQSPLEDLALRLVPPGVEFTDGASSIARVGTVLARSTVTESTTASDPIDQKAAEVIAGLTELKAVSLRGDPGRLAQLAVVVAGPAPRGADATAGSRDALLGLVAALDRAALGVVVLGAPDSATARHLVAQARGTETAQDASTVDTGGSVGGDLALVLALAEQSDGGTGDYGVGRGADTLLPDVSGGDVAGTAGSG